MAQLLVYRNHLHTKTTFLYLETAQFLYKRRRFYIQKRKILSYQKCYFLVFFLEHCEAVFSLTNLIFFRSFVLVLLSKLVNTSPPKPLNLLSSNFQGMFPEIPSCASIHYFSNMSVHLSLNQLSISLVYFH